MNAFRMALLGALALLVPCGAYADSMSYTGTLSSSTDSHTLTFSVTGPEDVTIQTYGFGGGVNAAGDTIASGGFDPFLGLFSGTGSGATILTDSTGNPYGTSDALSNFSSFTGCPPAGTQDIGGAVCGDITMSLELGAGDYTLLLSDGLYIPNAVFDNGTLGEGFTDFTGGAFQTCNVDPSGNVTCVDDTADWAFDVTSTAATVSTPEPSSLFLLGVGLLALAWMARKRATAAI
jgi:PEP-CTERM motif